MPLLKSAAQLVEEANSRIDSLSVDEAINKLNDDDAVFVDIRDIRELEREGMIPGAVHAPRGMLEFWVDPNSPYFKAIFSEKKTFILYCQSSWRSALAVATLLDMGMENISHIRGGFNAWKESNGKTVAKEKKVKQL